MSDISDDADGFSHVSREAKARIAVLEAALKPFAELGEVVLAEAPADAISAWSFTGVDGPHLITLDAFRAARAAVLDALRPEPPHPVGIISFDAECELTFHADEAAIERLDPVSGDNFPVYVTYATSARQALASPLAAGEAK